MDDLISHLQHGRELDAALIQSALAVLVDEKADAACKGAFLQALRDKGETPGEIAGFVRELLSRAVDPGLDAATLPGPMLDVCGTGGDRMELFNVSTTAMFVLAAGRAVIVKHGNRGMTSRCGGADVLEELGVKIDLAPAGFRRCVERVGIGFLFAPNYHPAFRVIAPVRKALAARGVATIFNILGPLLNPARPGHQLVGVFQKSILPKYAEAFALLGRTHAWAVHGSSGPVGGGVDEISTIGTTEICAVRNGEISSHTLDAEPLGFPRASIEELRGGDCAENARILMGVLSGHIRGAKRDVVVLNAAAGFVVADLAPDLAAGIALAEEHLDNGSALEKLRALQSFS